MPASVVKNKEEEHKWERAKEIAEEEGFGGNWAYIMGIFKRMNPKRFKRSFYNYVIKEAIEAEMGKYGF